MRRVDEINGLISTNMGGDVYDKYGNYIDPKIPGGMRDEALRQAEQGPPPPAMFRLWQEEEVRPMIKIEELANDESDKETREDEPVVVEVEKEEEPYCQKRASETMERMEDLMEKMQRLNLKMRTICDEVAKPMVFLLGPETGSSSVKPACKTLGSTPRSGIAFRQPRGQPTVPQAVCTRSRGRGLVRRWPPPRGIRRLRKLVRKDQEWEWDEKREGVVSGLKREFREGGLVLGVLNFEATPKHPFIVEIDAGPTTLGGILIQADVNGEERPLRFESRTLNGTERNYSQFKRETLAVFHCLRVFRNYLFGRRFVLRVDPTALADSLKNYAPSDPTIARWLTFVWMFDFQLERIPGNKNRSDRLSWINWDKSGDGVNEDIPPVDAFLDEEEDVKLHINAHAVGVNGVIVQGQSAFLAPARYVKRADIVLKDFVEKDPWEGRRLSGWQSLHWQRPSGKWSLLTRRAREEDQPQSKSAIEDGERGVMEHVRRLTQTEVARGEVLQDVVQRVGALEQENRGPRDMVHDLVTSAEQARQSTSRLEQRITDLEESQRYQATTGLVDERRTERQQIPIGHAHVAHDVEPGGVRLDIPRRDSPTEEPLGAMGMTCEEVAVVYKLMLEPDEIERRREAEARGMDWVPPSELVVQRDAWREMDGRHDERERVWESRDVMPQQDTCRSATVLPMTLPLTPAPALGPMDNIVHLLSSGT
ncbi:hypothetical protein CBR_g41017 [Chara braunii]|uniref:Reverse transcriptase RNase H-like domain-containing protein n=1 Tax=Chara braunii TaxID=69332 RepID=A0A388LUW0_CHABU|nr:hypothetical protein CBR_g41017 [Chara braunii]|eukprot:GBG86114.1 hypothetical protein CBR_g41017 [Chara braunii]